MLVWVGGCECLWVGLDGCGWVWVGVSVDGVYVSVCRCD